MKLPRIKTVIKHIVGVCIAYALVMYALLSAKNHVAVADVMAAMKITSLFGLVLANGEVFLNINSSSERFVKWFNFIVLSASLLICVSLILKYFEIDFQTSEGLTDNFKNIAENFYSYGAWISIAPLAAYAILDIIIMKDSSRPEGERDLARSYVVFNDLICLTPLMVIASTSFVAMWFGLMDKAGLEALTNAVVVSTIMASATATKIIELINEEK